jgi:hypothetical protein
MRWSGDRAANAKYKIVVAGPFSGPAATSLKFVPPAFFSESSLVRVNSAIAKARATIERSFQFPAVRSYRRQYVCCPRRSRLAV